RRLHDHPRGRSRRGAGLGAEARRGHYAAHRSATDAGPARVSEGRAPAAPADIERVFREQYGRAIAVLVRAFGDIDLAEDAVADAFTAAVQRWPTEGAPPSPAGWIIKAARNRAIDR